MLTFNVDGRIISLNGEGVVESTREQVKYSFQEDELKLAKLVFQSEVRKPQPPDTHDVLYLPSSPGKVEWVSFVWGEKGTAVVWGAELVVGGTKFPWSRQTKQ